LGGFSEKCQYFTAHIQDSHARRAYLRNAVVFLAWREEQGYRHLESIKPMTAAALIERLQETHAKPSIKQQPAAIRMLLDWRVVGQVVKLNPAHRQSRYVVFMADYATKRRRADYADRSAEKRPDSGERPGKNDYTLIMRDRLFS
jgi:hypothetical protein